MLRSNLEAHCYASNKIIIHTLAFSYLSFAILDSSSAATECFSIINIAGSILFIWNQKCFPFQSNTSNLKKKMFFNNKYCRQYFVYLKLKCFPLSIKYIKSEDENSRNKKNRVR